MHLLSFLIATLPAYAQGALCTNNNSNLVHDYDGYNGGKYGSIPYVSYVSTKLRSPLFQVNTWNASSVDTSKAFVFLAIPEQAESAGPMLFSSKDLSLVYVHPQSPVSFNTRVQKYKGQKYITYWAGNHTAAQGFGVGKCYFLDKTYNTSFTIIPRGIPNLHTADQHECQMTKNDTVIISLYQEISYDLSPIGGPINGTLLDSGFQEIDIATNQSVFTWWARDHFDITKSLATYRKNTTAWDWFHLNSVEKVGNDYLVSGRLLSLVTYIAGSTGKPQWMLGGRYNQFKDISGGAASDFNFQHHVRFRNTALDKISLFDNHALSTSLNCTSNCSRGMEVQLDFAAQTVKLVAEHYHPDHLTTGAEGSVQPQANANTLVGWGVNPTFTEYTPNGTCVWNIQYAPWGISPNYGNYRIFKEDWVGEPSWGPEIAAEKDVIFVSWNGATEVRTWKVYTGNSTDGLTAYTQVEKQGFETSFQVKNSKYVRVEGLDSMCKILGSTDILSL